MLELKIRVININLPENHVLLRKCRPLYEYSWLIQRIKEYTASGYTWDTAVLQALKDSEQKGILTDFIRKYGSEVVNMLFTQFNMDDALEVRWEEGHMEGLQEGEIRKLIELVSRKLRRGMRADAIAADLEESPELIGKICAAVEKCGPEPDTDAVYDAWKQEIP